jgi:hypothetical protein
VYKRLAHSGVTFVEAWLTGCTLAATEVVTKVFFVPSLATEAVRVVELAIDDDVVLVIEVLGRIGSVIIQVLSWSSSIVGGGFGW